MTSSEKALRCLISLLEEQCEYSLLDNERFNTFKTPKIEVNFVIDTIKHVIENFEGAFTNELKEIYRD